MPRIPRLRPKRQRNTLQQVLMRRQSLNTTRIIRPGTSHNNHQSQSATKTRHSQAQTRKEQAPASTTIIAKTHKHTLTAKPQNRPSSSTQSRSADLPVPDVLLVTPLSKPPRLPPQQALNLTKHRPRSRIHETHTLITSTRIPEQGQNLPATSRTRPSIPSVTVTSPLRPVPLNVLS